MELLVNNDENITRAYIVTEFNYETKFVADKIFGNIYRPNISDYDLVLLNLEYSNIKINEHVPEHFYLIVDMSLMKFNIVKYEWGTELNKGIAYYGLNKLYNCEDSYTFKVIKTVIDDKFILPDDLREKIISESKEVEI